ncbi:hypothetical protein NLG97_g4667 [Lecanicillium saksenae]|uniref:Uncharacterized protein n=1 Tax=Lecanicillium saksenae TaxID=468837 RepID=A0ACC1QX83_9HYPO|nr:hypothetical protein NLG97_g4667 [Lecanicillium saksenae]
MLRRPRQDDTSNAHRLGPTINANASTFFPRFQWRHLVAHAAIMARLASAYITPAVKAGGETTARSITGNVPSPKDVVAAQGYKTKEEAKGRTRKFHYRVRTGCRTCRSRHIKCDETLPSCKRCTIASRECVCGGLTFAPAPGNALIVPETPAKGLPSPDWHVKESVHYLFRRRPFAMEMLLHRLQCLFNYNRVMPRYGGLPTLSELWARLFHYVGVLLAKLNKCLATGDDIQFPIEYILKLMHVELSLDIPTWRAHAEGFGAVIRRMPRHDPAVIGRVPRYDPAMAKYWAKYAYVSQYPLVVSSICNATSPAHDQIRRMANWSDEDISLAYGTTDFHAFPCPTAVFTAMIRITHLRTLVAAAEPMGDGHGAGRANPYNWNEGYKTEDEKVFPLATRLYKTTVALYAVLSLPMQLAGLFPFPNDEIDAVPSRDKAAPSSTTGKRELNDAVATSSHRGDELDLRHFALESSPDLPARVRYTSRVVRLFRRALVELPLSGGLMFPAAVLGVALQGNGFKKEQDIVLEHVAYLRGWPASENGAAALHDKMTKFWASGKAGWEACFYEPTNVMT